MMKRRRLVQLLLILTIGHSATGAVAVPVVGIGNSTPATDSSYFVRRGGALSSDEQNLVVRQYNLNDDVEVILWRDLEEPIPLADGSSGLTLSDVKGISADGHTAVGHVESETASYLTEGAIWRDTGEVIRTGFLAPANRFPWSSANAVSSDGSVVVGQSLGTSSPVVATIWTEAAGLQAIPLADASGIPGSYGGDSSATGVSSDGRVVMGLYGSAVFVWDVISGTTTIHSRICSGVVAGYAGAISADGTTVVGTSRIDGVCQAYIWTRSAGIQALGFGNSQYTFLASPFALTPDGSAVVGEYPCPNSRYLRCAFIWTREIGLVDLRDLLELSGVDTGEWRSLQQAWGISADGSKVVGNGSRFSGQNETFIATLGEASTGVGLCEVGASGCVPVEIVARSGQLVPGSNRVVPSRYYSFWLPQVNGNGQLAFNADFLVGFGSASFSYGWGIFGPDADGQVTLRVADGGAAPGIGDGTALFHSLYGVGAVAGFSDDPAMNHAGDIAFAARIGGGGESGVWTSRRGRSLPDFVYQLGTALPSNPSVSSIQLCPSVQIDREGDASVRLTETGCIPPTLDSTIAHARGGAGLDVLIKSGDPAPGIEGDIQFIAAYSHWFNNFGNTALWGNLIGPGVDDTNDTAIWGTDRNGELALIVREGDPVPGFPAGSRFVRRIHGYGEHLSHNDVGQVAFLAEMSGPNAADPATSGLWKWSPSGSLELLVQSTDWVPGAAPGVPFGYFREPILNVIGDVAFRHGYTYSRYWKISANGDLVSLLGNGDQAPHLSPGVMLGEPYDGGLPLGDRTTGDPLLSDNGSTFLDFWLTGAGVDATNDRALYHVSPRGDQSTLVVRTGDAIEIALNEVRIVSGYTIGSGFRSGLGRRPTNARSDIVARVDFSDGSQAIVNFVVPEPGFGLGLALGCVVSIGLWRSRFAAC